MKQHNILRMLVITWIATIGLTVTIQADDNIVKGKENNKSIIASEKWLKLVDTGYYTKSWEIAATSFRKHVRKKQDWRNTLNAVRTPLGAVISRKMKTSQYVNKLPSIPDGDYIIFYYETSFEHKKIATETLYLTLETDKNWRVSGYFIQ